MECMYVTSIFLLSLVFLILFLFFKDDDRASRNLTKFNTEVNMGNLHTTVSAISHSNSELNVCPHVKGSTKGKLLVKFYEKSFNQSSV